MTAPIRVLVVDDSAVIRGALSRTLDAAGGIEVCGSAMDGERALARIEELGPDVVVLDVEMPGMDGLEATRILKAHGGVDVHVHAISAD